MEFNCSKCGGTTSISVDFKGINFVCPSCYSVFKIDSHNVLNYTSTLKTLSNNFCLSVGDKTTIKNVNYTITGALVKTIYQDYFWTEYILQDENHNFIYLSESNGHWIILKEIEDSYEISNHPRFLEYEDEIYNLYEYSNNVKVVSAKGFFDFEILNKEVTINEYVKGTKLISIEGINGVETTFFGESISKSEIQLAFPNANLPNKIGIGIVQPFLLNIKNTAIVFCSTIIIIFISHLFFSSDRVEKVIMHQDISIEAYKDKDFITPAFELKGANAPLSIFVNTNVNNSWANLNVVLVNEITGEEVYANKDIEYYHGYESGESWSEGSSSEEFNLCGVTQGKYHLLFKPMKDSLDTSIDSINVEVVWNKPSGRNVYMIMIFLIVIFFGIFYAEKYFETKKWEDSGFSPYN